MNNICKNTSFFLILIFFSKLLVSNNSYVRTSGFDPALTKKKQRNKYTNESNFQQLNFIENKGQILGYDGSLQPAVKFVYQQGNTQLFLLRTGIAYQFAKTDYTEGFSNPIENKSSLKEFGRLTEMQKQVRIETFRMDMTLVGANKDPIITKEGKSVDFSNYYNRNVLDVHSYNKITYHNIYPGIDWVIYSVDGAVKYDFVVNPGSDPSLIKMEFKHHEGLTLNEDGSFTIKNLMGSITEKKPISFQGKNVISTKFTTKENFVSFTLGSYNSKELLTIDPSLVFGTYFGGSGIDNGLFCSTDALGNVFLVGYTGSILNIASGGHQVVLGGGISDAFLVKYSASGVRLWSTYYGGSGDDYGNSCVVDATGNVYLAGSTTSTSNIASGGHQSVFGGGLFDGFLVKFAANGVRLWGTYYGGSGDDFANSCSTDISGNVYFAGKTNSGTNITSGGFQNTFGGMHDAFLIKFNGSGVRQWGTYYGGTNNDYGFSCSNDATGNVYLAGSSDSPSNIASGGYQLGQGGSFDAFLVKFNSNGLRLWATYYGGPNFEDGRCATDPFGNVYIAGTTNTPSNVASGGHQNSFGGADDAFLVKFNSNGLRLWATYYGGSGTDYGKSCVADNWGNIYLIGITSSTANIGSAGYQNNLGGFSDAFFAKFDNNGLRLWGTYYGGTNFDEGNNCSIDFLGNIYLAGSSNSSSNIASGGYQNILGGSSDAFLAKFCDIPLQPSPIIGNSQSCSLNNETYSVISVSGATGYSWIKPTGWLGTSSTNSISVIPLTSGILSVSANNACGVSPTQTINIIVKPSPTVSVISSSVIICEGESSTLTVSGAASYTWDSGINNNAIIVSPILTTNYSVIGSNPNGCSNTKSLTVSVNPCTSLTKNLENNIEINIYPNPNNGLLKVKLESYENTNLSIYDLFGKKNLDTPILQSSSTIDISNFASGIYLFVFRKKDEILKEVKVIKE